MLGTCSMDSDNLAIPAAMVLTGAAWLLLFFVANKREEC